MTQGLAVRSTYADDYVEVEPRLQLLVEQVPGYKIFFRNLFDLILRRTEPPLFLASQPVYFRRHFYVRTGVHWMVVLESIVWHMAAVPLLLVIWTWSLNWEIRHYPVERSRTVQSEQQLSYYPLAESFPAREGRQSTELAPERRTPHEHAMHVAKEQRRAEVEAPNVVTNAGAQPEIASSNPTLPALPLSATTRSKLTLPSDLAEVIGPAPDTNQLSMRTAASPATSVVAPAPGIEGLRRAGGVSVPLTVVAPAPALQGAVRMERGGGIDIGASTAVAPAPQLPLSASRAGRGPGNGTLSVSGVAVVPPSPSIRGQVFRPGGSGDLVGGIGTQVVPPSPTVEHALVLAGGQGNSLAGSSAQVVPPVPSVRGRAYLPGRGGNSVGGIGASVVAPSPSLGNALVSAGGAGNSLVGNGVGVVPPPPSIVSSGIRAGGSGRGLRSFGDVNGFAVPPSPSIGQTGIRGGNGTGRAASLRGSGEQVVAPAPSLGGSGLGSRGTGPGGGGNSLGASLGSQALPPAGMGNGGSGAGNGASGTGSPGSAGSAQGTAIGGGGLGTTSGTGGGTETVAGLGTVPLAGNAGGGSGAAPIISTAIPPPAQVSDLPAGKTQVVPLRVIQLALALPMTSYFSNYEAFIAERAVNRNTTQLIKLVYIFLPYQRRLTEFGVNTSKTFNLRVTRDPSCDESLLSMTWTEGEDHSKASAAESNKDKLPCYRTTADDYRKAWEKAR